MLDDTARAHTDARDAAGLPDADRAAARRRSERSCTASSRTGIARGVTDGDLPATVQPDELASFLVAVMRGMSGCARDGGSTDELLAIARAAVAAIPEPPTHDRR